MVSLNVRPNIRGTAISWVPFFIPNFHCSFPPTLPPLQDLLTLYRSTLRDADGVLVPCRALDGEKMDVLPPCEGFPVGCPAPVLRINGCPFTHIKSRLISSPK